MGEAHKFCNIYCQYFSIIKFYSYGGVTYLPITCVSVVARPCSLKCWYGHSFLKYFDDDN